MSHGTRLSEITVEIDVQEAYEKLSEKDRVEFLAENIQGRIFTKVLNEIPIYCLMEFISNKYERSSIDELLDKFQNKNEKGDEK